MLGAIIVYSWGFFLIVSAPNMGYSIKLVPQVGEKNYQGFRRYGIYRFAVELQPATFLPIELKFDFWHLLGHWATLFAYTLCAVFDQHKF